MRCFIPRAVAVIGASDDTTKHGYIVLTNVRDTGFQGGVYGISRRLTDVDGIPCFPDLASVPEPVGCRLPRHPGRGRGAGGARLRPRRLEGGDRRVGRLCRKPGCRRRRTPARTAAHRRGGGHPHRRPELQRHLQRASSGFGRLQHLARQAPDARRHLDLLPQRRAVRRDGRAPGDAGRGAVAVRLGRQRGRHVGAGLHGIRASATRRPG